MHLHATKAAGRQIAAVFCALIICGTAFGQSQPEPPTGALAQAGASATCPPHLDAFSCCLFKTCDSPAGPGCVAFCALGKVLTGGIGVFDPRVDTVTRFSSGNAVSHPEFKIADAAVYFRFGEAGETRDVVLRAGYRVIHDNDSYFRKDGREIGSPEFYIAAYDELVSSSTPGEWTRLGRGRFDESSGLWQLPLGSDVALDGRDHVVRATFVDRLGHQDDAFAVIIGKR